MYLSTLLTLVGLLWMGSELGLILLRRSTDRKNDRDQRSVVWLNVTIYVSLSLGILAAMFRIGRLDVDGAVFAWSGLGLIVLGIALRWAAILTLRRSFTVNVAIRPDQTLVTTGLYRLVRHPSYTGALLSFAGLAASFSNWITLAVVLIPIATAFVMRIRIEESALREAFGDTYDAYCASTWRLIPGVY